MDELLQMRPEGLYCPAGDFYIDPKRRVARAVVTHGHSDHLRRGMGELTATPETLAIADVRLGRTGYGVGAPLPYRHPRRIGAADIALIPAGHCLGSAQVLIEANGRRAVVTGDFKRDPDPSCAPFELAPCDLFVTEATFGAPVWRFPPPGREIERLLTSRTRFPGRTHIIAAYSLGKAQRLIAEMRRAGVTETIHIHKALAGICRVYEASGARLGPLSPVETGDASLAGAIIFAPPGGGDDGWRDRVADPVMVSASGWNRGGKRAGGSELSLIISDHADWDDLTATISDTGAVEVWIDHGPPEALIHWCAGRGLSARGVT